MARIKLTTEDREQLVEQYRQPGVTVASLAESFNVSSSTVSRILKENIPGEEYRELVKQKRSGRPSKDADATQPPISVQPSLLDRDSLGDFLPTTVEPIASDEAASDEAIADGAAGDELVDDELVDDELVGDGNNGNLDDLDDGDLRGIDPEIAASYFEDDDDEEYDDEFSDDEFSDDEDEFEDSEDEDGDELEDDSDLLGESPVAIQSSSPWEEQPTQVEVVGPPPAWYSSTDPHSEAAASAPATQLDILDLENVEFPRKCFAVVDRFLELTTCPLQDFNHLGSIPRDLATAKTLPIFNNHRIARRFSDRFRKRGREKYRVIDFPGYFLAVTRDHLQAKGIQYVLLDNQVYEL